MDNLTQDYPFTDYLATCKKNEQMLDKGCEQSIQKNAGTRFLKCKNKFIGIIKPDNIMFKLITCLN